MILAALACWVLGAAAVGLGAPVPVLAALALPAVLWAPGVGWARRFGGGGGGLQLALDAAWIGLGLTVVDVAAVRVLGLGAGGLLALSGAWLALGAWVSRGHSLRGATRREAWGGVGAAALLLAAGVVAQGPDLRRPLEAFWWLDGADALPAEGPSWTAEDGWGEVTRPGWAEAGAGRLEDPDGDGGELSFAQAGEVVVAVQGALGTRLAVADQSAEVTRDVQEADDFEPVPRYLDRGVAAVRVSLEAGLTELAVSGPGPAVVYVFPSSEGIWAVHHEGDLRFTHKWQILNIVENQRWAAELLEDRWITINQPPLWSHVLAVSVALVDPGLAGANGLLIWVLLLLAVSGVRLVEVLAPGATPLAWALPGVAALVHLELMVEPASTTFPDSLYAAAWVAGLIALVDGRTWRVAWLGLASGLLRYPGTIMLTVAAAVQRATLGRTATRGLAALWGTVAGVAALLAVAALVSEDLQHWLQVLWFETVPEHYDNNQDAPPIWQRPPGFYWRWLLYSGGGLLLAATGLGQRGVRFVLGSAVAYSLVLCTIDHFPTHYFLPLIALTAVAVAVGSTRQRHPALAHGVPVLAILGQLAWLGWGRIL